MRFDGIPPCTSDPDLWFSTKPDKIAEAKRVCDTCPFTIPCKALKDQPVSLFEAHYPSAEFGVWAGEDATLSVESESLTLRQREQRRRAEQIKAMLDDKVGVTEIGRRLGISHGSVNNIIKNYLRK